MHPDYAVEAQYLQEVLAFLKGYHAEISVQKTEIDAQVSYSLKHYNSDNPEQFLELLLNTGNQEALAKKVSQTAYALKKPYFARVDFIPDAQPSQTPDRLSTPPPLPQRHYIGKMTLMRDMEILITDWRAPVSSLYYEGRIGRAEYDCPDGTITGEIPLKRQYGIEQGRLENITDIDITTNDTFLQAALGASKDRRLKDIVTTIQAEQNKVIRAPLFTPLIVQGVAGGGKTTIALHRVAYLLYTYEKKLQPRHVMIMAPNRFFLSYISEVLPDLGVERVTQTTFEDFVAECVALNPKQWTINPASHVIADAVNNGESATEAMTVARLKSGLRFKTLIARYCSYLEKQIPPKNDFVLEGYELFTREAIEDLFLREYAYLPIAKRANEIHKNLTNTLKKEKPQILAAIDADYDKRREEIKRVMREDTPERRVVITELLNERDEKLKRVKNKSKVIIRQYMKQFEIKPVLTHYHALFTETWQNQPLLNQLSRGLFSPLGCALIAKHTLQTLSAKQLEMEDLPPVLLMQMKLFGLEDTIDIKHVVIDEAQDFSLFQFSVMKAVTSNASFSILGDLHQGIYAYKGVRSWEDVRCFIFPQSSDYLTLEQSYRTTVEIMDAANTVISGLYTAAPAVPLAKPVIRHGKNVVVYVFESLRACACEIDKKITACQEEGCHSIAVIGKTLPECEMLRKLLKTKPVLITGKENEYTGGLLLLPSYLVKGLEFDAVLMANASAGVYQENDLDIKLLYIAMTRALHALTIFSVGEPSRLISHLPVL